MRRSSRSGSPRRRPRLAALGLAFALAACGGAGERPGGGGEFEIPPPEGGTPPPPPPIPQASSLRPTLGQLHTGRRGHRATRLASGRVLLTGGFIQGTTMTDSAEVYDPTTEQFRRLEGRMAFARAGHSATRLADGRVLVAGGWWEPSAGVLGTLDEAEIFDPLTESFRPAGSMRGERVDHAALLRPDGTVLLTGGSRVIADFLADLDSVEVFDPVTETFRDHPQRLAHSRATHVMVDQGTGRWMLVGGSDTDLRPEVYDTGLDLFTPLTAPAGDLARFGAAGDGFASGAVAVAGGDALGTVLHGRADSLAVQLTGSGLSRTRAWATATRIADGLVFVAGGIDFREGGFVLPTCDLIQEGGPSGSTTWATPVRFPTGMADHTATRLAGGRVLFTGGLNPSFGQPELAGAYLFTPP